MRPVSAAAIFFVLRIILSSNAFAGGNYVPAAEFCASGGSALCSTLPAYIGPDEALGKEKSPGYRGILEPATSHRTDVQTPFDNMAWQMFVALNWRNGAPNQPVQGLTNTGERIWQTWKRVEDVFGNGPAMPSCSNPSNLPVFAVSSNGAGDPSAHNEEYLQASTGLPLIDVNGNWTIYERRLNDREINYIKAPNNVPVQNLNTIAGQKAFVSAGNKVSFPLSSIQPAGTPGAIEIKAAWRIIDSKKGDDPSRYFTMRAMLEVSGDLVKEGTPICDTVTLGLVGMHIIQKNPSKANLLDQWIWASFEHVDNAPLASSPCDPTGATACHNLDQPSRPSCGAAAPSASARYSYFDPHYGAPATNIAPIPTRDKKPAFHWDKAQPYAADYQTTPEGIGPQSARCWNIYSLTQSLNDSWQTKLRQAQSVFANYTLIGTQWGGDVEPFRGYQLPANAVPGLLSNITMETYIQNLTSEVNQQGPGSCIGCHAGATLVDNKSSSNFSFLPSLAEPALTRNIGRKSR